MSVELHIGGEVPLNIPEGDCALPEGSCLEGEPIHKLREFLTKSAKNSTSTDEHSESDIIQQIMALIGVQYEAEIWQNSQIRRFVGNEYADRILADRFKPKGPANSTALLNNNNIDQNLEQWAKLSHKLFNKKFWHIPFQMIDFADMHTELSNLDVYDLIKRGYDCFGVVMNTDISANRGKHWFCLYGDLAHAGTKEDPYKLEYFNSSGNPPMDEVLTWLEHQTHRMLRDHKKYCEIVRSAPRRLQHSKTECGVWSILYIRSRLENKPPSWFYSVNANDHDMIEMRKKIFR
jgi:hypothetical protein